MFRKEVCEVRSDFTTIMVVSEIIGILLVLLLFFGLWLVSSFPIACLGSVMMILFLFLVPFPFISFISLAITIAIICGLSVMAQLVVNHDQKIFQHELQNDD